MPHPIKGARSPRIQVDVTQEKIDLSMRRDSGHCMIADSLADAVPGARYISVDLATIRFTDINAGKRYVYLTPRAAQEALIRFDQGEPVPPFRFGLQDAHVLPTGNALKAKATLAPHSEGRGKKVPVRVGGQAPPIGPLAAGAPQQRGNSSGAGAGNTRGRRREYGLRALIR